MKDFKNLYGGLFLYEGLFIGGYEGFI